MTGSLIIVGFFFLGCLLGWSGLMPAFLRDEDLTMYVLYLLMFVALGTVGDNHRDLALFRPHQSFPEPLERDGLPGCRERFCLLFPFHYFDYPTEGADTWRADGGRVGNDCLDE